MGQGWPPSDLHGKTSFHIGFVTTTDCIWQPMCLGTQVAGRGFAQVATQMVAHPHLRCLKLSQVELDGAAAGAPQGCLRTQAALKSMDLCRAALNPLLKCIRLIHVASHGAPWGEHCDGRFLTTAPMCTRAHAQAPLRTS